MSWMSEDNLRVFAEMQNEIARLRTALAEAEKKLDDAITYKTIKEKCLAEIAGWALCAHAEGGGPGKCDLMECDCGPEGVAVAKAIARAL